MSLTAELAHQKNKVLKIVPKETLSVMNHATEELNNSGIVANCLQEGEVAADFILKNGEGDTIQLKKILDNSGVILKFFRGDW